MKTIRVIYLGTFFLALMACSRLVADQEPTPRPRPTKTPITVIIPTLTPFLYGEEKEESQNVQAEKLAPVCERAFSASSFSEGKAQGMIWVQQDDDLSEEIEPIFGTSLFKLLLPKEREPDNASEATTLVCIANERVRVKRCEYGINTTKWITRRDAVLVIVDLASEQPLWRREFEGEPAYRTCPLTASTSIFDTSFNGPAIYDDTFYSYITQHWQP